MVFQTMCLKIPCLETNLLPNTVDQQTYNFASFHTNKNLILFGIMDKCYCHLNNPTICIEF